MDHDDVPRSTAPLTLDTETTPVTAAPPRVGWGFLVLFFLAFTGLWVPVLAPVLVTLALKVDALVGPEEAGGALGGVVATGALLAMLANPYFGRLSDNCTSRWGMRRPFILLGLVGGAVGTAVMALAPNIAVLTIGFALNQAFFNAVPAGLYGVLADKVPSEQRGIASGVLGASIPVALPVAAFLVQAVAPDERAMFFAPLAVGAVPVVLFALLLKDRRLALADELPFSWGLFVRSFWVNPVRFPDFGFAWWGRFFFVLAYAFLTTYQAFFLINELGQPAADVPALIFKSTLVLCIFTLVSSVLGGKLSDLVRRRKVFVAAAAVLYGAGLFVITTSTSFDGFLVGTAIAGFGFGAWSAVDVALVVDVLPDQRTAAKDLGVFNIANTLPQSLAPAIAPLVLGVSSGSYSVLYLVAAASAVFSALFVLPIKGTR